MKQAVADGEEGVDPGRVAKRHSVHDVPDDQSPNDVDQGNDDAGDRISFDEFHGAIHRSVELAFFGEA